MRDPTLRDGWAWGVTGGLPQVEGLPVGYGDWQGAGSVAAVGLDEEHWWSYAVYWAVPGVLIQRI